MSNNNADDRFDAVLLSLAQNISAVKGPGLDPILETFFSFLRRKTDFFTGADVDRVKEKLDEHVRKQMKTVSEEQEAAEKIRKQREQEKKKKAEEEAAKKKATTEAAAAANVQQLKTASGATSKVSIEMIDEDSKQTSSAASAEKKEPEQKKAPAEPKKAEPVAGEEEESEEDKGKLRPNEGNGADLPTYSWVQTLREANIQIPLPPGTTSKQIVWEISKQQMTVGLKNQKPFLKGKLFADVHPDECHWTLEDFKGVKTLCIHLDKIADMQWWDKIVEGEPAINTKKVTPENSKLGDLDSDTRQVVEKMMFDQRQKAMGKPSSDELKKLEALEKLKKANPHLDFSNVQMGGGGGFPGF